MVVDQDVIKITTGTAITTCHSNLEPTNNTRDGQTDELIIIDPESSESSSDESDVEVVKQYKLDDIRPVIGEYSKWY